MKKSLKGLLKESVEDVQKLQKISAKDPGLSAEIYGNMQKGMDFLSAAKQSYMQRRASGQDISMLAPLFIPSTPSTPSTQPVPDPGAPAKKPDMEAMRQRLGKKSSKQPPKAPNKDFRKELQTRKTKAVSPGSPVQMPNLPPPRTLDPQHQVSLDVTAQQLQNSEQSDPFSQRLQKKRNRDAQALAPTQQIPVLQRNMQQMEHRVIRNKKQLREATYRAYVKETNSRKTKRVIKEHLTIQLEACDTALVLLEGVWDAIKSKIGLGADVAGKVGGAYQGLSGDAVATARDQKVAKIIAAVEKEIKAATSERQKFNSQILKSAQMMNAYNDSVMKAFSIYKRFEDVLGPAGMQVNRQINNVLEALEEDLMSEVSQIQAMLSRIGKKDQSLDDRMKTHKEKAEMKREKEADIAGPKMSSFRRAGATAGADPKDRARDLRGKAEAKPEIPTSPKEQTQRVKQTDDEARKEAQRLTTAILKSQDKAERSKLTQELYNQVKKMKGLGMRSKHDYSVWKKDQKA